MNAPNHPLSAERRGAERQAYEPSMEEILASIRRIIADDQAFTQGAPGPVAAAAQQAVREPPAMRDLRPRTEPVVPPSLVPPSLVPPSLVSPSLVPPIAPLRPFAPTQFTPTPIAPRAPIPQTPPAQQRPLAQTPPAPNLGTRPAAPAAPTVAPQAPPPRTSQPRAAAPSIPSSSFLSPGLFSPHFAAPIAPTPTVIPSTPSPVAPPPASPHGYASQSAPSSSFAPRTAPVVEPQDRYSRPAPSAYAAEAQFQSYDTAGLPPDFADPLPLPQDYIEEPAYHHDTSGADRYAFAERFEPAERGLDAPLVSPQTDAAVSSAFHTLLASQQLPSDEDVKDMVRDMLRPMLKAWLDDNLPVVVERLVRAEIERVARGGR